MSLTDAEERAVNRDSPVRTGLVIGAYVLPVLVALVVTEPGLFGLSGTFGFLHVVSFPLLAGICWVVLAVPFGLVALLGRRRYAGWLAVVALLAAATNVVTVVGRGFGDGLPTPAAGNLTVVTYNGFGGAAPPAEVARRLVAVEADAVALPETPRPLAEEIAAAAKQQGRPMQVFGGDQSIGTIGSTSLLVAKAQGDYRLKWRPKTGLGAVVAAPVDGRGPILAAVHAPPPLASAGPWRDGVEVVVRMCRTGLADVVMGDVNATVDHAPLTDLGRCVDAASETGDGAEGTWPASLPTPLAAPIDHVLVNAESWRPLDTGTTEIGDSDHRVLVAELEPA